MVANQESNAEEAKQYVPDVVCLYCHQEIHIPANTYAFFAGEIGCARCSRKHKVEIGGYDPPRSPYGGGASGRGKPATVPYFDSSGRLWTKGQGLLLSIEPIAPIEVVQGLKSPPVPEEPYRAVQGAIKCLEINEYESSAGRSRFAIQAALLEKGIPDMNVTAMVGRAENMKMLSAIAVSRCKACIFIGNSGSHPQVELIRRIGPEDALEGLRLARRVLLELYDPASITHED